MAKIVFGPAAPMARPFVTAFVRYIIGDEEADHIHLARDPLLDSSVKVAVPAAFATINTVGASGLPRGGFNDAAAGRALDEAGQENRALVDGLRRRSRLPSLREALDSFLTGARPAASVTVRVTGDETLLPERFRQELFLVLREALRNAFAHAAADRVEVGVRTTRRWLYAKVEDFGPGPGPDMGAEMTATPGPTYGLCSMTERVEELGGRLRISAGEQGGTLVEIHLPLAPRG
ncbi:ATP-binding protein [Streptomyces sp. NBC_00424]|uniref:sensor histidine kinase n=1 Tax=Streptomyces sp. NBC_00424 TaxID=2903648 RepID=UPI002257ACCF|nr:ATP-binding protein [Streptomyces sp. NBC_00424]MCX5078238.1 ATP-binding protein [Streptomyces sp. NBC_00424]